MEVANLALSEVRPNPNQPRKLFDIEALQELADSIRELGLMQPIVVRPSEPGFEVIAGERRFRACSMLGMASVPCMIIRGLDDEQAFILSTTENVARRDMTIIEEANAFQTIIALGKPVAEVGKLFGKTEAYINYRLDLLRLKSDLQEAVSAGTLASKLAHTLSQLSHDGQRAVVTRMSEGKFKNDSEATRYARIVKGWEAQPGLTADLTLSVQQYVAREDRGETRSALERALASLEAVSAHVETILGFSAEDLASALGGNVEALTATVETLSARVNKAKYHALQAAAVAGAAH